MSILKAAMEELGLSARAYDKVLRVARTLADLEASDEIKPLHIAAAEGYRSLDRSVWM
jgi:magnesium chelatase family protein